jgi:hypothetical protein
MTLFFFFFFLGPINDSYFVVGDSIFTIRDYVLVARDSSFIVEGPGSLLTLDE